MTWSTPVVTVPPASDPVTLDEAKAHCRVTDTSEDALLTALIAASRDYVEAYCGIALAERTVEIKADEFADFSFLPIGPVSEVSAVEYIDPAAASQTLATSVYELRIDGLDAAIALKPNQSWPSIQSRTQITVTAVVGGDVPEAVKHALLLLIGQWFDVREATSAGIVSEMPQAVTALLTNWRRFL